MDVNRQNKTPWHLLCVINRHVPRCIYKKKCVFWFVLCVHYRRVWMHTERPVHSGLCYVCPPDSCMNVYSKKNALWLLLHAFTRYFPAHRYIKPALLQHIWVTERHQEASLATCVQLVTVPLYC